MGQSWELGYHRQFDRDPTFFREGKVDTAEKQTTHWMPFEATLSQTLSD